MSRITFRATFAALNIGPPLQMAVIAEFLSEQHAECGPRSRQQINTDQGYASGKNPMKETAQPERLARYGVFLD